MKRVLLFGNKMRRFSLLAKKMTHTTKGLVTNYLFFGHERVRILLSMNVCV